MSSPRPSMRDDAATGAAERRIVAMLLQAYRVGAFPMGEHGSEEVNFYQADPRGVLPLSPVGRSGGVGFHVPRRLERVIRQQRFELRCDTAFEQVVRACAAPRAPSLEDRAGTVEQGTWINQTILRWYTLLHRAGHAHSVEAWTRPDLAQEEPRLVGGVYGVSLGSAFFGESMFHVPGEGDSAGQVCLVHLVRHLQRLGYTLFDTQMVTGVVRRFGALEVPLAEYLGLLEPAVRNADCWKPFKSTLG